MHPVSPAIHDSYSVHVGKFKASIIKCFVEKAVQFDHIVSKRPKMSTGQSL